MSNTNSASGQGRNSIASNIMKDRMKNQQVYFKDVSPEQIRKSLEDAAAYREAQRQFEADAEERAGIYDKNGKRCTLAEKLAEIDKRDDGIYAIPIIGSIVKLIMQACYKAKVQQARVELANNHPVYSKMFTTAEKDAMEQNGRNNVELANGMAKVNIGLIKKYLNENELQQFLGDLGAATKNNVTMNANKEKEQEKNNALVSPEQRNTNINRSADARVTNNKVPAQSQGRLQITGTGAVKAGTNINPGTVSRGAAQSQSKGNFLG